MTRKDKELVEALEWLTGNVEKAQDKVEELEIAAAIAHDDVEKAILKVKATIARFGIDHPNTKAAIREMNRLSAIEDQVDGQLSQARGDRWMASLMREMKEDHL